MSYMACDILQRIKKSLMHIVAFSREFFFSDQFRVNSIATSKIWGFLMQRACCYNKQLVIFKTNITYMGNIYQKPTVYIKKRKIVIEKNNDLFRVRPEMFCLSWGPSFTISDLFPVLCPGLIIIKHILLYCQTC